MFVTVVVFVKEPAPTEIYTDCHPLSPHDALPIFRDAPAGLLADVTARLRALADWNAESVEAAVRETADAAQIGLGKLAQPLRAALTGRSVSPDRKSTRLNSITNAHLVCRLLLEKKK